MSSLPTPFAFVPPRGAWRRTPILPSCMLVNSSAEQVIFRENFLSLSYSSHKKSGTHCHWIASQINYCTCAMPSDAFVFLLDGFTHSFSFVSQYSVSQVTVHQIIPIRFQKKGKPLAAKAVKLGSAEDRSLHSTVSFHQRE